MPPKSRKRNKGKERKAKKANNVEIERVKANGFWQECLSVDLGCFHGHDNMTIADNHPVSCFLDEFFIHWIRKQKGLAMIWKDIFEAHPQVWKDINYNKLVTQVFILIGTNMLLAEDINNGALSMAKTIVALEHYDSTEGLSLNSVYFTRSAASKRRDLEKGSISIKRDLLKFYRKRLPCKCLKRMHLEARKTTPKMGRCYHCNIEKERVELSVCTRCMIMHFCSKECQVAAWPTHYIECDKCYKYNKQQQKLAEGVSKVRKSIQEDKQNIMSMREDQAILKERLLGKTAGISKMESEELKDLEERLAQLEKKAEEHERSLAELDPKC